MPIVTAFPAASTPLVGDEVVPLIQGGTDSKVTVDDLSAAAVAYDAELAAIAGLTSAADRGIYFTGSGAASLFTFTAAGRALLDDATAAAQLTTLGLSANGSSLVTAANYAAMRGLLDLEAGTDFNAYSARLADIAGITYAQGDVFYYNGSNIVKLAAGTSGQFLKTNGAGANPAWAAIGASGAITTSCGITIDGGGSAIIAGIKGDLHIPVACTITAVTMLGDTSGSIVVDIWKDTYANFPPTDADSITSATPPTITTATKSQDTTLSSWTVNLSAGDILRFNVDSCTDITRLQLQLTVSI